MRLNCKEASRLLSQAMDRKLSPWDRTRLRLHLVLCDACNNFDRQVRFLRRAVAQLLK